MKSTLILFFLTVPLLIMGQESETPYKIFSGRSGKEISLQSLLKQLKDADVVVFGEEHNDPTGHELEKELFEGLYQYHRGDQVLSLEMFETDVQQVLNEYLHGLILSRNLEKDGRAWKNYDDYQSMVEFSKTKGLLVLASNAPSRYTSLVNRRGLAALGELDSVAKGYLPPLLPDTLTGPYYDKFVESMGGHASLAGGHLYEAQCLWDASMAYQVAKLHTLHPQSKVFHVNGRFHSDEKLGMVAHLAKYAPKLRTLTISCFSDESFPSPSWQEFAPLGDFIIITDPEVDRTY